MKAYHFGRTTSRRCRPVYRRSQHSRVVPVRGCRARPERGVGAVSNRACFVAVAGVHRSAIRVVDTALLARRSFTGVFAVFDVLATATHSTKHVSFFAAMKVRLLAVGAVK